jgi:hypothetical protein
MFFKCDAGGTAFKQLANFKGKTSRLDVLDI